MSCSLVILFVSSQPATHNAHPLTPCRLPLLRQLLGPERAIPKLTEYAFVVDDIKRFGAITFRSTEPYERDQGQLRLAGRKTNYHRRGLTQQVSTMDTVDRDPRLYFASSLAGSDLITSFFMQIANRVTGMSLCALVKQQTAAALGVGRAPVQRVWRISRSNLKELNRQQALEGDFFKPLSGVAAAIVNLERERQDKVSQLLVKYELSVPPLWEGSVFAEDIATLHVHHSLTGRSERMLTAQFVLMHTQTGDEMIGEFFFACRVFTEGGEACYMACINVLREKTTTIGRDWHNKGLADTPTALKLYRRENARGTPKLTLFPLDTIIGRAVLYPVDVSDPAPLEFWGNPFMSDVMALWSYMQRRSHQYALKYARAGLDRDPTPDLRDAVRARVPNPAHPQVVRVVGEAAETEEPARERVRAREDEDRLGADPPRAKRHKR